MEIQGPRTAQKFLKKKNRAGGFTLEYFKTYYEIIKTGLYWYKGRHIDVSIQQWKRIRVQK